MVKGRTLPMQEVFGLAEQADREFQPLVKSPEDRVAVGCAIAAEAVCQFLIAEADRKPGLTDLEYREGIQRIRRAVFEMLEIRVWEGVAAAGLTRKD